MNGSIINNLNPTYKIIWYLNNFCNFNCEYCLDEMGRTDPKNNKKVPLELMTTALENILSLDHNKYNFTLFGGETTLYPDLPEFLDLIYEIFSSRVNNLMITTNASRGIPYFENIVDRYPESFIVRISIHPEHYNPKIFEIIEFLSCRGLRVFIEIMYNLNYKKLVFQSAKRLADLQIKYPKLQGRIKPVFRSLPFNIHDYFYSYSNKDIEEFYQMNSNLGYTSYKYKNDLRELGKYCILYSNKIMIEPNGNILCPCPISKTGRPMNIFRMTPKTMKNIFSIQKCTSDKICLHASKLKFDSKEEAKRILIELKDEKVQ